nr:NERD domain-containing protein [Propionibacterium sp.]
MKRMRLRYAGTCARCGTALAAGTTADYDRASKTVACVECPPSQVQPDVEADLTDVEADPTPAQGAEDTPPTLDVPAANPAPAELATEPSPTLEAADGQGGASAAAEFQRRHDARQERVLTNHPRLGRFLLAVFDDPQSTRAWSVGAEGERMLSEMLASMAGESLRVLNDRRIPRSRANIDHLVVCPSGVFVVDAKRYRNARPELRVEGGLLRPRTELLYVGGRDRTSLVAGMHKQVSLVRDALADQPEVRVQGVLCFIDADWPVFGGSFTMNDVAVVWPKKLKATLTAPGVMGPDQIADLQWRLHEAFPRQKQAPA